MDTANDVSNTAMDKASKDISKDLLALQKTNQRLMGGMMCMGLLALVTCGVSIAVAVLVRDCTDSQETSANMAISANDVLLVQDAWADAVLSISNTYLAGGDFVAVAGAAAAELYGYGHSDVLFKPTLASVNQFRPTANGALSYFVGNANVANGYAEDGGFAINGGKGWSAVVFENHQIEIVLAVQDAWANAVVNISSTYLAGGDFVAVAGAAAAELYGYGYSNVLFKPTLASVNQFRPNATGALSYFVGNANVANGYAEDGGFAINGGKGWSAAVFENHQIEINGNVAAAMGNYYFTSADDGNVSKVEYSFNYKRTEDGKLRIFLHHSSKPYSP
ncbi:unnamed protein product [Symbiodinium sp. CCMP2456]|nr:unnamed protein product [Symbiodinium sp. CCMP2456]